MKKYLLIGLLTMALILPLAASAVIQTECCKMVRSISVDDTTYTKGYVVGSLEADYDERTNCKLRSDDPENKTTYIKTNKWGVICSINMMNIVINWIFVLLIVLVILLTMIGAFLLMTAGGNEENVTKGRKYIMWAAVGLIVALVARAVPSIVTSIFG